MLYFLMRNNIHKSWEDFNDRDHSVQDELKLINLKISLGLLLKLILNAIHAAAAAAAANTVKPVIKENTNYNNAKLGKFF